ncbi:SLBB domain-containing protein [bacterium]|nr:SLBB domain-containing protein [bacterium]
MVVETSMRFLALTAISLQILSLLIGAAPESPSIRFYDGAQNPQNLAFKENMTLLQAIALGGGETGPSIERVAVFREGQPTTYHDIGVLRSNPSKDVLLTAGDKVVVCDNEVIKCGGERTIGVSVHGEVKMPARVPFVDGMTLLDAIAAVGGLTNWANKNVILLAQ